MGVSAKVRRTGSGTAVLLLVCTVGMLAFLTLDRVSSSPSLPTISAAPRPGTATVVFDRFSALRERSPDGERLRVSLRLSTTAAAELPSFVFVVARNDKTRPKLWAIWPQQPPGPAITSGGHFHGAAPGMGHAVTLSHGWTRITATLAQPAGRQNYDTVLVYVVGPNGKVYLARPFRI